MHLEAVMVAWSTRLLWVAVLALVTVLIQRQVTPPLLATSTDRTNEPSDVLKEIERSLTTLFDRVSPSVVRISTIARSGDPKEAGVRIGSGFLWDSAGHVVTNEHVVRDATIIWVFLASGKDIEAEVVGIAPNYDLAVLRLKQQPDAPAPPILIGTSKDLKVGHLVATIGSPFALDQSFSVGVVSALKRQLPTNRGHEITDIIQTSAAIYPGNSGGPLVDSTGRLVGVNTLSYAVTSSNAPLGFAIPIDLVSRIVPELIRNGRVPTAGIGIVPSDDKEAVASTVTGVVISRIRPGSPAERAGLQGADPATGAIGDVITKANDAAIQNVYDLTNQLERVGIGNHIVLTLNRRGATVRVEVEIVDIDRKDQ
jgi:S1-C subfamily serine protease